MTTRGRTLAALAAAMLLFGRLGGMRELVMAGAAFALVLGVGAGLVWARRGRLAVRRRVEPGRVFVGGKVRVELEIEAAGRLGLGPLLVADRTPRGLGASPRLSLPGGTHRRSRTVAYAITPRMRGRYAIGPVELTHTDPFGAVRRRQRVSGTSRLLVLPTFEDVTVLPTGSQRAGAIRHSPLVGQGDEFFALRAYEEGDDLRKIHWPSALRTGQLVVRQEELLAEPRALIVLDTTASKHRGRGPASSMEAAVSACASVGVLAVRRRMRLEIVTPDGPLLGHRLPSEEQVLEALAVVQPSKKRSLVPGLRAAANARPGRPAIVVVITPSLSRDEVRMLAARIGTSATGAIVALDAASFDGDDRTTRLPHTGGLALPVMRLRSGDSFRHVWHSGIRGVALAR